jgi:hypothetical protein
VLATSNRHCRSCQTSGSESISKEILQKKCGISHRQALIDADAQVDSLVLVEHSLNPQGRKWSGEMQLYHSLGAKRLSAQLIRPKRMNVNTWSKIVCWLSA